MQSMIKPMDETDTKIMAEEMREMDRFEFRVMSRGRSEKENLDMLLRRSRRSAAAYVDGEIVACYGVVAPTELSTVGHPWMCASDLVGMRQVRVEFLRRSNEQLAWMSQGFDFFWNLVSTENRVAIRWLKWLGFNFTGDVADVDGHPFAYFKMEAEDVLASSRGRV